MQMRKCMCFALCVLFVFALFGCEHFAGVDIGTEDFTQTIPSKVEDENQKTFSANGVQITLPDDFTEFGDTGAAVGLSDGYSAISAYREPITSHPSLETYSLEEYAERLIQSRNMSVDLQKIDGLLCFEYEVDVEETVKYSYFVVLFKTKTDFWIFEFVSDAREAHLHRDEFVQWAKTVTFTD